MAEDLITPLLDQNQSDTLPPSLSPTLPSTPSASHSSTLPTTPPPSLSPTLPSTPNSGLFKSLQSCCPPSILFNRRPGHARAIRFRAPPSQQETDKGAAGDGEDNIGGSLPTSAELLSYRLGIVPMEDYKVSIRSEAELKDLWKLVLERREIQKFVENTIKRGREQSKKLGFAGSLVLLFSTMIRSKKLFSTMIDAKLDEHLSNTKKVAIFSVFLVIIIVYTIVSNIQLHYIYDPALSDARIRYEDLLVMTNLARRKLLVPKSKPRVASSIMKEWELQKKFDEYCKEIQKPLLVRWNRCSSFVELNSIALAFLMAFIVKGMPSTPKHH